MIRNNFKEHFVTIKDIKRDSILNFNPSNPEKITCFPQGEPKSIGIFTENGSVGFEFDDEENRFFFFAKINGSEVKVGLSRQNFA